MNRERLEHLFALRGRMIPADLPDELAVSSELLGAYVDGTLAPKARRDLERRALREPALFEVLRALVDTVGVATPEPLRPVRVAARLLSEGARRGLELLNPLALAFEPRGRALALGPVRSGTVSADLFSVGGPGRGLDRLELQAMADGSARLGVRCDALPALEPGEGLSIVRELDGRLLEKRPFDGSPIDFTSVQPGRTRLALVARAPGRASRTLSEAVVDLQA